MLHLIVRVKEVGRRAKTNKGGLGSRNPLYVQQAEQIKEISTHVTSLKRGGDGSASPKTWTQHQTEARLPKGSSLE